MSEATIRVQGLRELQRSFAVMGKEIRGELRKTLREIAEPVRMDAQSLAASNIRNIGPRWSLMRVGVTSNVVYVAPRQRRRGGSPRPNLGPLLMDRAMGPALDDHAEEIYVAVDIKLNQFVAEHGF